VSCWPRRRRGRSEQRTRLAFEISWLLIGVALGGPIGFGTVLVAFLIGPSVARGHRMVEHTVCRSRHHLAMAHIRVAEFAC
jgi:uncharacterized membrane protein YczE